MHCWEGKLRREILGQSRDGFSGQNACCASLRTRVQILRLRVKASVVMRACNPRTSTRRRADPGGLLVTQSHSDGDLQVQEGTLS